MAGMIYVVVPVFNRKALTERFLCCMREQTFPDFRMIIVDDGSTDGTSELIAERFPEVRVLRGNGSLWWTGGVNLGIEYVMKRASANDAILLINDDVEVGPEYVATLHSHWQQLPNTLIGSLVVDIQDQQRIVDGGRIVNWWTAKFRILNQGKKLSDFPKNYLTHVSLLTGWGTLIPCRVFSDVGLFDAKHFQQCGDTELPVRARNAGYQLVVSYDAILKVHLNASDGVNVATHYSLKDIKRYFCDVKSNFRLKYRWYFNRNTARNRIAFVSFGLFDMARITGHFIARLRLR